MVNEKNGFFGTTENVTDRNCHFKVIFSTKQNLMFLEFWKSLSKKQQNTVLSDYDYDVNSDCYIIDILKYLGYKIDKRSGFVENKHDVDIYIGYMRGLEAVLSIDMYNMDLDIKLSRKQRIIIDDTCLNSDIILEMVD